MLTVNKQHTWMCALLHTLFKSYFKKYEDRWKHLILRKQRLEQSRCNRHCLIPPRGPWPSSAGVICSSLLGGFWVMGGPFRRKAAASWQAPFLPSSGQGLAACKFPHSLKWELDEHFQRVCPREGANSAGHPHTPCGSPALSLKQGSLCSLWGCRGGLLSKHQPPPWVPSFSLI